MNDNTEYFYRVRAYNLGGASGNSNTILLTTLQFPPNAPVATAATNITETTFDANWNTIAVADGYYLDVALDNGFSNFVSGYNNLDVGDVITYNVSGLYDNTEYFYRVRAYNFVGASGNSNIIDLTTLITNLTNYSEVACEIKIIDNVLVIKTNKNNVKELRILIYTINGLKIFEKNYFGLNNLPLPNTLSTGIYLFVITDNKNQRIIERKFFID